MNKQSISILADSALYNGENFTGSTVQLFNLARLFAENGHDVRYHYRGAALQNSKPWSHPNHRIIRKPKRKGLFNWIADIRFFRNSLNKANPDIVYTRGRSILCYVAGVWCRKNGKLFVWGTNGDDSCEFWKRSRRLLNSRRSFITKMTLIPLSIIEDMYINKGMRLANKVVNQSDFQKEQLELKMKKEGVVISPVFRMPEIENAGKKNLVLWVGSLTSAKNPEDFVRIAKNCMDKSDWKFLMVGGAGNKQYHQEITELANNIQNLSLTGELEYNEVWQLFSEAAVFVSTSRHEGFSNTFVQAWLSSVPVLSLNHDPDGMITKNNIGKVCNGDIEDLENFLQELMKNAQMLRQLAENSRNLAISLFTGENVYKHYQKVFEG